MALCLRHYRWRWAWQLVVHEAAFLIHRHSLKFRLVSVGSERYSLQNVQVWAERAAMLPPPALLLVLPSNRKRRQCYAELIHVHERVETFVLDPKNDLVTLNNVEQYLLLSVSAKIVQVRSTLFAFSNIQLYTWIHIMNFFRVRSHEHMNDWSATHGWLWKSQGLAWAIDRSFVWTNLAVF